MGFNAAGTLAVFQVIARPHLLLPKLIVKDIRQLDLKKLSSRGVTGVVIDKDNCLTKPLRDAVVPELTEAWPALIEHFGKKNVLIVSNSAGTRDDAGLLQAESVSRHLGVPVLMHAVKKPGCGQAVLTYFSTPSSLLHTDRKGKGREYPPAPIVDASPLWSSLSSEAEERRVHKKILVIGDRVMTDVLLANRINRLIASSSAADRGREGIQAIPILTTTVWQMEGPGSRIMRALEGFLFRRAMAHYSKTRRQDVLGEWKDCIFVDEEALPVKEVVKPLPTFQERLIGILASITRPAKAFVGTRSEKLRATIEGFVKEAGQQSFGFRFPEGVRRVRLLRSIIEGSPNGTSGYRK